MGMRFSKKDYPRLYGTFYAIGVNTVVWVDGEEKIEIDLPEIAKQADMSQIEPVKETASESDTGTVRYLFHAGTSPPG